MKKLVKSIAVVVLMFVAVIGLAKEPKLNLTPNSEKSLNFQMDIASEKTSISIVDAFGATLFSEAVIGGKVYSKKFDLKNLPEGTYFLEVENTLRQTIFELKLDESDITIIDEEENIKPVFRQKEGRVFLNLLNLEKENVKVKVLNSDHTVLFEEIITNELIIEKVFNFKNAFESTYTVVVQNNNDVYYETILVK